MSRREAVRCPICGSNAYYAASRPGYARDSQGRVIPVVRRIFLCTNPKCCDDRPSFITFLFRTDGQEGELHKKLKDIKSGLIPPQTSIVDLPGD